MVAAGIGFAMTFVYVGLIVSEGDNEWGPVTLFAVVMALASTAALVAAVILDVATSRRLLAASAVMFGAIGVLGIFSVGLPFLGATAAAVIGLIRIGNPPSVPGVRE